MTTPCSATGRRFLALVLMLAAGVLGSACAGLRLDDPLQQPSIFEELVQSGGSIGHPTRVKAPGNGVVGGVGRPRPAYYQGDYVEAGTRSHGTGARQTAGGYELNFNNVELSELVKVVLRDTLQTGYVFDPRVQGKVTISTGRSVSRDELIESLEAILLANGAALVRRGDQFHILPDAEAQTNGAGTFIYASEQRAIGRGYGVTILPLRHVAAGTVLKLLEPFASKPGTIRAAADGNLVFIRGSSGQRRSLLEVAKTFDVDWMRGQSAAIYPLNHAGPEEVIEELTAVFRTSEGRVGKGLIRFQPIERLNAVLVLSHRDRLLDQAGSWIRRLDKTNTASANHYIYTVEHGNAENLANVLNAAFGGAGIDPSTVRDDVDPADPLASTVTGDTPTLASVAASGDVEPEIAGTIVPPRREENGDRDVRIVADKVNNKLLIYANGRNYRKVLGMLRRLDRVPTQVLINATLAEVTLNDNLRYGVQVFLREQNSPLKDIIGFSNNESLVIQPELPGLNILAGLRSSPKAILDALANETNVRVVSSPSVVVRNNRPAKLQVGDEVPIATRQATSVTDPEAPIVNNIEFRETGVILHVTPNISSNGLVNMKIEQEISNVTSTATVGGGTTNTLTPTISQRKVESSISVYGGQMVVLAGLISERRTGLKNRVPIWEKVPVLGNIPGKTDNAVGRTELVIFLTPHVIANPADASLIANELKTRMQLLEPNTRRKYKRWPKREDDRTWHAEVVE
ncbi:MAG: type II secretion system secretin GspD [Hyphomicrobiaceae bacterium]